MGSCLSIDASTGEIGWGAAGKARIKERKRKAMEALAAEAKANELLSCIPGRMCCNNASDTACVFSQQGKKGTNQDAMLVWENFASRTDTIFCGVFDGHGPHGHRVARKVRDSLPSKLTSFWLARTGGPEDSCRSPEEGVRTDCRKCEESCKDSGMFRAWQESFLKAYDVMDSELKTHPKINCFRSGTTAVAILIQGQDLIIGNVGDSRAILGTVSDDDTLEAVQLTVDLKPNLPSEAERIKDCKGRIFAVDDEPEILRVWLPHDDSPGLAMTRAFGDFCLKDFGLIAIPEITYRRLTERDQFIVLASDGVWDVLSNNKVVDVISSAPSKETAAKVLVETAARAWKLSYPNIRMDDCTAVCLYLNHTPLLSSELEPESSEESSEASTAADNKDIWEI